MMVELTIANFADHHCSRKTFTKIKRGPKAAQWCSWCHVFLRPPAPCPVRAMLAAKDQKP